MLLKKNWLSHTGFWAIAILYCIVYYSDVVGRLPYGIHDWAQADRLSLAINFYDHGMNFLQPATQSLYSKDGIAGVEFPLQSYLAAALGYIFGRQQISNCYRLLDICIALSGLYALFLIVYERTRDFVCSIFTPLFIFCSPVYVYYSGNFLPDSAAVSICFIGFYFFFRYLRDDRLKSLYSSFTWLTLAVLIKTSTITYLAGISIFALGHLWRKGNKRELWQTIVVGVITLALILGNLLYVKYLDNKYHSPVFLAETRPFKSWDSFTEYFEVSFKRRWMNEYLLSQQYIIYIFIVTVGLVLSFQKSKRLVLPIIIFLAGACTLSYFFGEQLKLHDYYILPLFFPLLCMLLLIAMISVRRGLQGRQLSAVRAGVLVVIAALFLFADYQIFQRQKPEGDYYDANASYIWMEHGAQVLDDLHISRDEQIVVGDNAPNLGLVYCDRRGYNLPVSWLETGLTCVRTTMQDRNASILVCSGGTLAHIQSIDPAQLNDFAILSNKDNMAVLRWTKASSKPLNQ